MTAIPKTVLDLDEGEVERMVAIRRDIHQHPELSGEETRTSRRVEERLHELGLEPRRMLDTGIVADLPGPEGVPVVALRADLDALPIQEETGLPFASAHDGVMHACGHDGHTAMLLGAAAMLRGKKLPAPVRLIFQPAEELGTGARDMTAAGVLDGVGLIFGAHLDRHYDTGHLVVTPGAVNASTDQFFIRVSGQGAHAARPHEAVDAVVVGSLMVMAIQTIVSREVDPAHPSVVSVGKFQAGTVSNAIAGQAVLEGTIRAQHAEVREQLKASVRRIAESVAGLHGARLEFEVDQGTPPLVNPEGPTRLARRAAEEVVGASRVEELSKANMGGEDFSYYLQEVEGCYARVGSRFADRQNFPAHSSRFDFDERALTVGARWFAHIALGAGRRLAAAT